MAINGVANNYKDDDAAYNDIHVDNCVDISIKKVIKTNEWNGI